MHFIAFPEISGSTAAEAQHTNDCFVKTRREHHKLMEVYADGYVQVLLTRYVVYWYSGT